MSMLRIFVFNYDLELTSSKAFYSTSNISININIKGCLGKLIEISIDLYFWQEIMRIYLNVNFHIFILWSRLLSWKSSSEFRRIWRIKVYISYIDNDYFSLRVVSWYFYHFIDLSKNRWYCYLISPCDWKHCNAIQTAFKFSWFTAFWVIKRTERWRRRLCQNCEWKESW